MGVFGKGVPSAATEIVNLFTISPQQLSSAKSYITTSNTNQTASTLETVVSYTGAGCLDLCTLNTSLADATRTMRLKVTIDGVSAFDEQALSVGANNMVIIAVGENLSTPDIPIFFEKSLLIEMSSSIANDAAGMNAKYRFTKF